MFRWLCCSRGEDDAQSCWWVCCTRETYRQLEEEEEREEGEEEEKREKKVEEEDETGEREEEGEEEEREGKDDIEEKEEKEDGEREGKAENEEEKAPALAASRARRSVETRTSAAAALHSENESESLGCPGALDRHPSGGVDAGEGGGFRRRAFGGERCGCRGGSGTPQSESKLGSSSALSEARGSHWDDHVHSRDSQADTRPDDRLGGDLLKRGAKYGTKSDQQSPFTESETRRSRYRDRPADPKILYRDEISSQNQPQCHEPKFPDPHDDSERQNPEHGGDSDGDESRNRQSMSEDVEHRQSLCEGPGYKQRYEIRQLQFVDDYFHDTGAQHFHSDGDSLYQELSGEEKCTYHQAHLEGIGHETPEYVDSEDCTDYSEYLHRRTSSNADTIRRQLDKVREELESESDTPEDQRSESGSSEDVAQVGERLRPYSFSNRSTKCQQNSVEFRDRPPFAEESVAQTFEYSGSDCDELTYHVKESSSKDSDENFRNETSAYDEFMDDTEDEYFLNCSWNDSRTKKKQNGDQLEVQTYKHSESKTTENQSQNTSDRSIETRLVLNSKYNQRGLIEGSAGNYRVQTNTAKKAVGPIPKILLTRNVEVTTARPHRILSNSGILEVESDKIEGGKAKVFFHRDVLYLNQKKVEDEKPLSKLLKKKRNQPWGCVARAFPTKKNGDYKKITGVEVQLIASLVWVGDKPSPADVKKLGAGKVSQELKPDPQSELSSRKSSAAGGTAQAKKGNDTLETAVVDSDIPNDGMMRGRIREVTASHGVLQMPNGAHANFRTDQCFLYGVCLQEVQLSEVIPEGTEAEFEMCEGLEDLKGVWVGGSAPLEPSELHARLEAWCRKHGVPHRTAASLLCLAGWLPDDLAPVADLQSWKEIVEVSVPANRWETAVKRKRKH